MNDLRFWLLTAFLVGWCWLAVFGAYVLTKGAL